MSFAIKDHPPAEMIASRELRLLAENGFKIFQVLQVGAEAAVPHSRSRFAVIARFGIAQPYPARLSKIRCQNHIQQAALTVGPHLRHAANGRR